MTQFDRLAQQDGASEPKEVLLEARMCSKSYQAQDKHAKDAPSHLVLDCVQVKIHAGEFVALLGPSGSGKSTLLRILAGLLAPSSGQVFFKGTPQYGPNPYIAIVFQSFALFPWLTVLQNVELGLEAREMTKTQRLKKALAAIDLIGLDGFEDAYPKELSGGMRQRVGFARALVVEPELLFMDEPFSALDVLTAANLRKELLGLWRAHTMPTRAILMVTHNIDEAVSMADRILIMGANPGHIRVELAGLAPEQRSLQSEAHTTLVDLIYRIMKPAGGYQRPAGHADAAAQNRRAGRRSGAPLSDAASRLHWRCDGADRTGACQGRARRPVPDWPLPAPGTRRPAATGGGRRYSRSGRHGGGRPGAERGGATLRGGRCARREADLPRTGPGTRQPAAPYYARAGNLPRPYPAGRILPASVAGAFWRGGGAGTVEYRH